MCGKRDARGPSQPATVAAPSLSWQLAGFRRSTLLLSLSTRTKLFESDDSDQKRVTYLDRISGLDKKSVRLENPQQFYYYYCNLYVMYGC